MEDLWFWIIVIAVLIIAMLLIGRIVVFQRESKYIKMEIARAVSHREKAHWQRKLKKLKKDVFLWRI